MQLLAIIVNPNCKFVIVALLSTDAFVIASCSRSDHTLMFILLLLFNSFSQTSTILNVKIWSAFLSKGYLQITVLILLIVIVKLRE